ncbi:MAG: alpha/beta fold hydrolase [Cyanobacteriota bacterium]|nr:alpha/beta fold hydrolase [Cyanobacteriota bacterium]
MIAEHIAVTHHIWSWQGFPVRYQRAGEQGSPLLLIHGFGASSDHWRHNLAVLGQNHRVFAIDLLGFGGSAKPTPADPSHPQGIPYTFETWAAQVIDFCHHIIGEPTYLAGNSIGGIVALQAAVTDPDGVVGVALLNPSLRLLHERKRAELAWHRRLSTPIIQTLLTWKPLGHWFFRQLAQPKVIRQILEQAYGDPQTVTDELVQLLLKPAQEEGAADVFLAFIRYSQGPLLEDLLPRLSCPALLLWGSEDPWEPIEEGRQIAQFSSVKSFIELPGVGHCPQDEAPTLVNRYLREWLTVELSGTRKS